VAVFIVNTIGRIWFLEYQEPEYTVFLRQSKNFSAKAAKSLKRARMYLNIFYVISIYVGIFYWKWIGVLQ
jgi:hypothetical protein